MEKVPYLGQTLLRWKVGQSTFLALPEKGARLMNWHIGLGDGSVRDVIYWPEMSKPEEIAKVRGGNPILFPFAGRCFDRGDIYFWRDAAGIRRPMPMHGIARQSDFRIVSQDARGFTAQLVPGAEAKEAYPFDYEFTVTYRFEPLGLTCELKLTNLGKQPLPWCAGHHFYFTLPWSEGSSRGDYLIRIPAGKHLQRNAADQMLPVTQLQVEESLANPSLIDTVHTELRSNEVVFGEKGRPGDVIVRLGAAKVPPAGSAFVTWTADAQAPYYCVEPWMGPANAPENKVGLAYVAPGTTGTFTVSVNVK